MYTHTLYLFSLCAKSKRIKDKPTTYVLAGIYYTSRHSNTQGSRGQPQGTPLPKAAVGNLKALHYPRQQRATSRHSITQGSRGQPQGTPIPKAAEGNLKALHYPRQQRATSRHSITQGSRGQPQGTPLPKAAEGNLSNTTSSPYLQQEVSLLQSSLSCTGVGIHFSHVLQPRDMQGRAERLFRQSCG